jgi:hypothetical protein
MRHNPGWGYRIHPDFAHVSWLYVRLSSLTIGPSGWKLAVTPSGLGKPDLPCSPTVYCRVA